MCNNTQKRYTYNTVVLIYGYIGKFFFYYAKLATLERNKRFREYYASDMEEREFANPIYDETESEGKM